MSGAEPNATAATSPTGAAGPTSSAGISRRTLWTWLLSLIGGAALLWLASRRIQLLPERIELARLDLLVAGVALYLPYAAIRALRLRYALDPVVARAAEPGTGSRSGSGSGAGLTRVPTALLYGSGWVSFFVILLLPLRLGELSRPVLLARPGHPGLGFTEALSAVATERAVDGLLVVALLFLGLSTAADFSSSSIPGVAERVADIQAFGRVMAVIFALALAGLIFAARAPASVARLLEWLGSRAPLLRRLPIERVADIVERLAAAIRPLGSRRHGLPFLLWSLLYWLITVLQLWLLLRACGLALGLPEAATIVAVVGLSIQLPGGPAQAGSFQVGTALGLGLFIDETLLAGPGSSFAAIMYLLGLIGAAVMAGAGAWLLARGPETPPPGEKI